MGNDTIALVLAAASLFAGLVAGLIRYGLLPYLREQLQLNREIHQQITPSPPTGASTMRDELGELREELRNVDSKVEDVAAEVGMVGRMFDGHLDWSQGEVDRLWAELGRARDAGELPPVPPRHRHRREDEQP